MQIPSCNVSSHCCKYEGSSSLLRLQQMMFSITKTWHVKCCMLLALLADMPCTTMRQCLSSKTYGRIWLAIGSSFSVAVGTSCWQTRQHIVQRCKRFFQFFCQLLHVELETVPPHLNKQQDD
jgi:hypothetical protein